MPPRPQPSPPLRIAREDDPHPAPPTPAPDPSSFQSLILAHLDAAHNLAWWLLRNDEEAADAVQESCLKALRSFPTYRGGDPRSWLLSIVRNTAYSRLRSPDSSASTDHLDLPEPPAKPGALSALLKSADAAIIRDALSLLPTPQREALVLCDLEGLTYAQISLVSGVPPGTVMSRLSRARDALRTILLSRLAKE